MLIFNPLYDQVFKYLMENTEMAKKVLFTILGCQVSNLQIRSIETPIVQVENITVSRYDFKAIISLPNGNTKEVLIEVQKYKSLNPLQRFRDYLSQNYEKKETYIDEHGKEQIKLLPIIAIYILGYDLPEFDVPFIKVKNNIYNGINNSLIEGLHSEFVSLLTHECYILIAAHKENYKWQGTRIEAFIRLFRQKTKGAEPNIIYEIEEKEVNTDGTIQEIATYLNRATLDSDLLRKVKIEEDYDKAIKNLEKENKELLQKTQEAIFREIEAKQHLVETVQNLKKLGIDYEIIAKSTGLSVEKVKDI